MTLVILFVLGLIIGSFLNVLGLRWNSGISIVNGRSFCVVCRKNLRFWELIPVISFVGLRGKCSECDTKISWQYPLVELWTGLVFASLYFVFPLGENLISTINYILAAAILSIFIVITIYDARHKIIPDDLVYSSIIIAVAFRIMAGGSTLDILAGPMLFAFFASVWFLSQGRAMGFGDAKLALAIGLFLGGAGGLSAFVLAFWIGTAISLLIIAFSYTRSTMFKREKKLTMKSEIPFAPYLVFGAWISLIYHLDLFHVLSLIN
jgi:leader peptidase (prepilin peptidase)/N-methyltransferase